MTERLKELEDEGQSAGKNCRLETPMAAALMKSQQLWVSSQDPSKIKSGKNLNMKWEGAYKHPLPSSTPAEELLTFDSYWGRESHWGRGGSYR